MFKVTETKIILLAVVVFVLSAVCFWLVRKPVAGKEENVKRLITTTGIAEKFIMMAQARVEHFKKDNPSVPEDLWVEIQKKADINQRIKDTVFKNYSEFLSSEDAANILRIMKSAKGRAPSPELVAKNSDLLQKFHQVQSKTARELEKLKKEVLAEAQEFLKAKGYNTQISPMGIAPGVNPFFEGRKP